MAEGGGDVAGRGFALALRVLGSHWRELSRAGEVRCRGRVAGGKDMRMARDVRWLLVDHAPMILPELGRLLGGPALRVLRRRGLDVRLETTIEEVTDSQVRLSDGTIATRPSRATRLGLWNTLCAASESPAPNCCSWPPMLGAYASVRSRSIPLQAVR